MRSPEFGTRKEKEQFVGYSHNFERYVVIDDQVVDRLQQALQYGFLSPREAERLKLPYKRSLNITMLGFKDPDNIIFLFPLRTLNHPPHWSNAASVIFDRSLNVLSHEEMREYQGGHWPHLSPMYGEVYFFGRIDPSYIRQILLPNPSMKELEQVRELVRRHVPAMADIIMIR